MRTPRLMAISDRGALAGEALVRWAERVSRAGVDTLQLREKDLSDRALLDLAREIVLRLAPGARLVVNGRADIAVAAGAHGVHLPATGVPASVVRERFPELLVGRSTHEAGEVESASRDGAHYVTFGPVWATPSKAAWGDPPGLSALAEAAGLDSGIPVLALGGVRADRLAAIARAGGASAAAIRAFLDPSSTRAMVDSSPFQEVSP